MATNADIQWWLAQHPGASDATMRGAMNQSDVAPGQVARATGWDPSAVFQRYQAAGGMQSTPRYNAGDIQGWLAANPNATDEERRAAMMNYGVTTGDVANATGMDVGMVDKRYQAASPYQPLGGPTGNTQAAPNTSPTASGPPPIGSMGVSVPNPATGSPGGYGNAPGLGGSFGGGQNYGANANAPGGTSMFARNGLMQKLYPGVAGGAYGGARQNALTSKMYPGVPGIKNYLS